MKNSGKIAVAVCMLALVIPACKQKEQAQPTPPQNTLKSIPTSEISKYAEVGSYALSEADQSTLLKIARETVEGWVKNAKAPEFKTDEYSRILLADGAAFVTLKENGRLRGCIGHIIAQEPLWMCARDMAIAASTEDPRFSPVKPDELKDIHIEVSVLTPLQRVPNADSLVMGRDGVILRRGGRQGVFLPQVATETGWDKATFLSELCSQKAGLSPDCWRDPETELYSFRAIVFAEPER